MAIDKRYQDNIILKKDAFQNLLTNIKNYPIVDIDYVTESDIDELHGDEIWPNYTNGMPCIKITYGDDRSTKGNIIFKEDWRKYLNKANKEMARLNSILNEYERRRARWIKIYNQNKALEEDKRKWLESLGSEQVALNQAKQDFLLLGLNFLYKWGHPEQTGYYITENGSEFVTNIEDSIYSVDFPSTFSTKTLVYNTNTHEWSENATVGTKVSLVFLEATANLKLQHFLQTLSTKNIFNTTENNTAEDKIEAISSFIDFLKQYNFLILQDVAALNEIPDFHPGDVLLREINLSTDPQYEENKTYYRRNKNDGVLVGDYILVDTGELNADNYENQLRETTSTRTYYTYKDNIDSLFNYLNYTDYNPDYSYTDFYNSFKAIANSVLEDIANAVGNTLTICQDQLTNIDNVINWLKTQQVDWHTTTNPESAEWENATIWEDGTFKYKYIEGNGSLTCFVGESGESTESLSVEDYNNLIADVQEGINTAATQTGPNNNEDRTLYGYKYVKVGSNIQFDNNYSTTDPSVNEVTEFIGTENDVQASGTFRITINGHTYEIPIKGIGNVSDQNVTIASGSSSSSNSQIILYEEPNDDNFDIDIIGDTNLDGNLQINGNLIPNNDDDSETEGNQNNENIGADDQRWGTIYATNGDFNGNVIIGGDLLPDNNDNDTESIGASDNPWGNAYITTGQFDNINIKNPNYDENDPNETDPPYVDLSDYINNAVTYDNNHQLYVTNTADGIKYTDENDVEHNGFDSNSSRTYSGDDNASIHTEGGIYAEKNIYAERVFNAVFNDYAEYRTTIDAEAGRIVVDNDDGSLSLSSKRLQPGAQVISDTFGHAMGATDKCQTPLAVAGRALVYTYKDRNEYHAGMAVCSAPNGTVDIMTREEIREYPDCIIGIVSEIPDYEVWGSDNVKVNGRIWIKVK